MKKLLKMIWDFRGPDAYKTAEHHEIHLKQYMEKENISGTTGITEESELHTFAFMIIAEQDMIKVRDELRPHRATWHQENN